MIEPILSRLEGVKRTSPETWIARCPSHDDKTPSLALRETVDGRILAHCFAGCGIDEILGALGLGIDELFPDGGLGRLRPISRPWPAADVLECVGQEAMIVAIVAAAIERGDKIPSADSERCMLANRLINAALDTYRG